MKKIKFVVIFMISLVVMAINYVNASNSYTLKVEVLNNKKEEAFDIYVLLPKNYIEYCIKQDGLDIEYNGPETLIENDIPSIRVEKENVKSQTYEEDGIEYIQILLKPNSEGNYEFEIREDYTSMDMKIRVKNLEKDYIMHIENFKIQSGICLVQYDYEKDTVKQPDTELIPFIAKALIIILIIVVAVGLIAYIKQRR